MDCREAREILLSSSENIVNIVPAPRQREAREHLATCQACQAGLARLAEEIKKWEQNCGAVQEMLPAYVEDELAEEHVQARYPRIWQHLQECSSCARAHAELRYLVQLEREGGWIELPAYPTPNLPFLPSISTASRPRAWTVETFSDAQGHLSAVITIAKAHITNALFPQAPAWARSGESPGSSRTRFPLMDSVLEGSRLVSVEILREQGGPSSTMHWHLRVSLASPTPLGRMQVRVGDDREERAVEVNERGEALFRDVPLTWLSEESGGLTNGRLGIRIQQIEA